MGLDERFASAFVARNDAPHIGERTPQRAGAAQRRVRERAGV
jgi:hypothetical protein